MKLFSKSSVLVIYTGGTIGMIKDAETGLLIPFNFDKVHEYLPSQKLFGFNIESFSFDPVIDSSDMHPRHWINIAQLIYDQYENCLLYTSDAADDLLCVDLGGRRIIKKKLHLHTHYTQQQTSIIP